MSTVLFVPSGDVRKLEKACALPIRGAILDLEDAIAPDRKPAARAALRSGVEALTRAGKTPLVRMNAVSTRYWEDDLVAIHAAGATEIILPKLESVEEMRALDVRVDALARARPWNLRVGVLLESAAAVVKMERLLAASPRIAHAGIGFVDLCGELGISADDAFAGSPPLFMAERVRLALVSRALGLEPPYDTVWLRIDDADGLRADTLIGRRLGLQGKLAIHPAQVAVINEVYAPTEAEIARARRIVDAFEASVAAGTGALSVDGMMIDIPVVTAARKILERAMAAGEAAR